MRSAVCNLQTVSIFFYMTAWPLPRLALHEDGGEAKTPGRILSRRRAIFTLHKHGKGFLFPEPLALQGFKHAGSNGFWRRLQNRDELCSVQTLNPGSKIGDHGSWIVDRGSWIMDH
jgi:hypothetical protein